MTFEKFLLILRARLTMIVSVFFAFVVSALALYFILPKQFTATASVVVDSRSDPLAVVANAPQVFSSYLATQVDIITSQRVAERVVKLLKLDEVAQFKDQWKEKTGGRGDLVAWLATQLQNRTVVTLARESGVLNISVQWPNGKAAATIANAFAQAYIDTTIELKVEPAKQYAGWFDQRSKELRADLQAKQKALSDYQNESQITSTDMHLDIESARLAELSSQLTAIQALRQESQSRQPSAAVGADSLPEVLQSPIIANLKASLALAEAKLKNISVSVGKNHPDYQDASAEISSLQEKIVTETAKITASLHKTTQSNFQREEELRKALDAQKKRVLELKHEHDKLDELQNDVLAAQQTLNAVSQRLAQSSLESLVQQTNVLLLTAATEPQRPSSPKLLLSILLGILLGASAGVGIALFKEMMNPLIRSSDDALDLLGIPVLGSLQLKERLAFERSPTFLSRLVFSRNAALPKPTVF